VYKCLDGGGVRATDGRRVPSHADRHPGVHLRRDDPPSRRGDRRHPRVEVPSREAAAKGRHRFQRRSGGRTETNQPAADRVRPTVNPSMHKSCQNGNV